MQPYAPVSSNDALAHLALPSAPETLCGKPIADEDQGVGWNGVAPHPNTGWAVQPLECDLCSDLAAGQFLVEGAARRSAPASESECPWCDGGIDESGAYCWSCGGTGFSEDPSLDLSYLETDEDHPLAGTKIASDPLAEAADERLLRLTHYLDGGDLPPRRAATCQNCGEFRSRDGKTCASCGTQFGESSGMLPREEDPPFRGRVEGTPEDWNATTAASTNGNITVGTTTATTASVATTTNSSTNASVTANLSPTLPPKVAINYTRDGFPIEDGFRVVLTREEAARVPFLDLGRVTISERLDCPDCERPQWLSRVAACDSCGQLKCIDCLESVGQFLGTCRRCASSGLEVTLDDGFGDDFEPPNYLDALDAAEQGAEFDGLFLQPPYDLPPDES